MPHRPIAAYSTNATPNAMRASESRAATSSRTIGASRDATKIARRTPARSRGAGTKNTSGANSISDTTVETRSDASSERRSSRPTANESALAPSVVRSAAAMKKSCATGSSMRRSYRSIAADRSPNGVLRADDAEHALQVRQLVREIEEKERPDNETDDERDH